MPCRVEAGDVRQESLSGADIAGRFFAANVLLARLERQSQSGAPCGVGADTDQSARQCACIRLFGGEKRGMRPAETHRHAEALGTAHCDIEAQ